MICDMSAVETVWLLLVISLPTASGTARMRIWRALKTLGSVALRDGAYLLPAGPEGQKALGEQYAELRAEWKRTHRTLSSLPLPELARLRQRLQRDFETVRAIDFFPSDASAEAEAAWLEFGKRIDGFLSPDEPRETSGRLPRLDAAKYRGRTWATRRRLWVDRVASAWLIRRFIDRDAKFRWLAKPSECPKSALGFDFDGAAFTHVGDRVTFETLLASFGLDDDPALARLGAMVHTLDVGGEQVPEAAGFQAVMAGARERLADDDALLLEISAVLDSLYLHFQRDSARGRNRKAADER
jgi:hypothetical protein